MQLFFLFLVLESISVLALLDCLGREDSAFAGGAEDRKGWIRWLIVAVATAWFLVGDGIVLGYYFAVIRRNPVQF